MKFWSAWCCSKGALLNTKEWAEKHCVTCQTPWRNTAILSLHFPNPRGWHSLLGANAPEITLNTNQVKVKANKNIYLQNIKTDNIVTGIYKDIHNRKERKLNIFTGVKLGMTFCTTFSRFYWSRRAPSAAPTCAEGTRNWVPNHQILRDSIKMLAKLYPLCFWCCKKPEENSFCASGSQLNNIRKVLRSKCTKCWNGFVRNWWGGFEVWVWRCENKASGALRQNQL